VYLVSVQLLLTVNTADAVFIGNAAKWSVGVCFRATLTSSQLHAARNSGHNGLLFCQCQKNT